MEGHYAKVQIYFHMVSFSFCLKDFFTTFRVDLLVMNSYSFCMSENILISAFIFKEIFVGIEFWFRVFVRSFVFSTLEMLLHCFGSIVSDEKS